MTLSAKLFNSQPLVSRQLVLRPLALVLLLSGCERKTNATPPPVRSTLPSASESSPELPPPAPPEPISTDLLRIVQPGDIVFQTSRSAQSEAVQAATRSRWSHMGLVLPHGPALAIYEAVGPVKYTPVEEWAARGVEGRVLVMRMREPLPADAVDRLARAAEVFRGLPYDAAFSWTNERMYCSELVWKVYRNALGVELGHLARLGDFDLTMPAVRSKLRERYGGRVPLEEPVISPQAIADSPELFDVVGGVGK